MDKAYVVKFDYSIIAVALNRADAEELVCDCAMEQGLYYFNLYKGAGYDDNVAVEEANRNMSYFFIDEIPLI